MEGGGGGGGGGGGARDRRPKPSDAQVAGAGARVSTGALCTAKVNEIRSAIALLGGREAAVRETGLRRLVCVVKDIRSERARESDDAIWRAALGHFRTAVAAARGIPLVARVLRETHAVSEKVQCHEDTAVLIQLLAARDTGLCNEFAEYGCIAPLISLLASDLGAVKSAAAGALCNLGTEEANAVKIVVAGGVPPLFALSRSPTEAARYAASSALRNLGLKYLTARARAAVRDDDDFRAARLREIPAAVAMLGAHEAADRRPGLVMLTGIFEACLQCFRLDASDAARNILHGLQKAVCDGRHPANCARCPGIFV
jgi:hypothetical protein